MTCPECGAEIPDCNETYCINCGKPLSEELKRLVKDA